MKKRDRRSSMFGFLNKITRVSYVPDSKKRKNVVFFCSINLDDKIDPTFGDDKKPDFTTFYNATKAGIDMIDQMAGECNTSRNSCRWPMTVFYSILNVSTINAYLLNCHKPKNKLKLRFFIKSIRMQLIEDNLKRRMQNIRRKKDLKAGIERLLPKGAETSATREIPISRSAKNTRFMTGHLTIKSKHCVQVVVNTSAMIIESCQLVAQNAK